MHDSSEFPHHAVGFWLPREAHVVPVILSDTDPARHVLSPLVFGFLSQLIRILILDCIIAIHQRHMVKGLEFVRPNSLGEFVGLRRQNDAGAGIDINFVLARPNTGESMRCNVGVANIPLHRLQKAVSRQITPPHLWKCYRNATADGSHAVPIVFLLIEVQDLFPVWPCEANHVGSEQADLRTSSTGMSQLCYHSVLNIRELDVAFHSPHVSQVLNRLGYSCMLKVRVVRNRTIVMYTELLLLLALFFCPLFIILLIGCLPRKPFALKLLLLLIGLLLQCRCVALLAFILFCVQPKSLLHLPGEVFAKLIIILIRIHDCSSNGGFP
mmetsp:Transcript_7089/g.20731  ORF Transcript_7089/g.20731 Transcript_7089/m.20731 type:complete len:326 (-) Transcript_7089:660-1637(-)